MARLAGVNVPSSKRLVIALTYILGIGKKYANDICSSVSIDKNKRVNNLTEDEIIKFRECIDKNYIVGIDSTKGRQLLPLLKQNLSTVRTSNVLTEFMLPLSANLSKKINLAGFDGREVSDKNFWQY